MPTRHPQTDSKSKKTSKSRRTSIHWSAMGAGLLAAVIIYPEQQPILISLSISSFLMHYFDKTNFGEVTEQV